MDRILGQHRGGSRNSWGGGGGLESVGIFKLGILKKPSECRGGVHPGFRVLEKAGPEEFSK